MELIIARPGITHEETREGKPPTPSSSLFFGGINQARKLASNLDRVLSN